MTTQPALSTGLGVPPNRTNSALVPGYNVLDPAGGGGGGGAGITLDAGTGTGLTGPGLIPDGGSGTFAATTDTPQFAGLGLGGAAAGAKKLKIYGSTSGAVTVQTAAIAGANTLTLPAATGTVVTTGDTGTVSNTMLANSSVTVSGHSLSLGGSLNIASGDVSGLAASATTDTTNAANITSGTLPNTRLSAVPNTALANSSVAINAGTSTGLTAPGAISLGSTGTIGSTSDTPRFAGLGLGGTAAGANSLKMYGSTSGAVTVQTAAIAGANTLTIPAVTGTAVTTGDTGSVTNTMLANSSVTVSGHSLSLGGSLNIASGDVSGLAASATTDTTNAANITSGTLPNTRLSAVPNSALANSTVTINAGTSTGLTAPGAISLGSTGTIGSTSDTPQFSGLGLGGAAAGAKSLKIYGSTSGAVTVQAAATAGANTLTIPAVTGTAVTTGDTGTVTNTMLANSSLTVGSTSISLGATAASVSGLTLNSGCTLTDNIDQGFKVSTSELDATSNTTLATVTGLSVALTAGKTYFFRGHLALSAGASGGAKFALVATSSLSATSISYAGLIYTGTTLSANTTTTTLGTAIGATAATTDIYFEGAIVVNVAGTINVQGAQNVSNGTTTKFLINSTFQCVRVN